MDISKKEDVASSSYSVGYEGKETGVVKGSADKKGQAEAGRTDSVEQAESGFADNCVVVDKDNPMPSSKRTPEDELSTSTRQQALQKKFEKSEQSEEGFHIDHAKTEVYNMWTSRANAAVQSIIALDGIYRMYADAIIALGKLRAKTGLLMAQLGIANSGLIRDSAEGRAKKQEIEAAQQFSSAAVAGAQIGGTVYAIGKARNDTLDPALEKKKIELEELKKPENQAGDAQNPTWKKEHDEKVAKLESEIKADKDLVSRNYLEESQTNRAYVDLSAQVIKSVIQGGAATQQAGAERDIGAADAIKQANDTNQQILQKIDQSTNDLAQKKSQDMDKLLQGMKDTSATAHQQAGRA